jgi:hypothetical protein
MNIKELLINMPAGATHVSVALSESLESVEWLRYEGDREYSIWMDGDNCKNSPYWRVMPDNCIEYPQYIRCITDLVLIEILTRSSSD